MSPRPELQLLVIRLCAGFAFFPHAADTLFAGMEARERLAQQFAELGLPHALPLVVLAGVIELAAGLMLVLGCWTRTAAIVTALYLLARAYILPPSYAMLWMLVCASFVIAGGGRWSVDGWLKTDPPPRKAG